MFRNEVEESLWRKRFRKRKRRLVARIQRDFRRHPERYADPGLKEIVAYLGDNGVSVFPYPYTEKYDPDKIEVMTDEWEGLKYVMHHGKRLYFRRGPTDINIRRSYSDLLCEQDPQSPHCYLRDGFGLEEGSVLFDIGCAEANFALENIERVSKVFLFEMNEGWLAALRRTFEPWKEKVVIINKFVSDHDGDTTATRRSRSTRWCAATESRRRCSSRWMSRGPRRA